MNSNLIFSELTAEGYDDSNGEQLTMLVSALSKHYGMRRWKFLENEVTSFTATVANQGKVTITSLDTKTPIDVKVSKVRWAFGTDYRGDADIDAVSADIIKDLRHTDREPGFPYKWARVNDEVWVWPIPNATYPMVITYYSVPAMPASVGDVMVWPQVHMDVLVQWIIMRLARRQRDGTTYDRAKQEYELALANMQRADDADNDDESKDYVQPWRGWRRLS